MSLREQPDIETSSSAYARRFAGSVGQWFLERQTQCTAELLGGVARGARVLEVGGGHAQVVPLLIELGFDVTVLGSDLSCAARLDPWLRTRGLRFHAGDLLALPYPDQVFDVVLGFRLLPHVAEWRVLLSELCRVAAQRVVVDYPSRRSLNVLADRLFGLKRRLEGDTRPFTLFDSTEIASAFSSHGLVVTGERGQFFLPMALHRGIGSAAVARALEAPPRVLGLTHVLGSPKIVRADRPHRATRR